MTSSAASAAVAAVSAAFRLLGPSGGDPGSQLRLDHDRTGRVDQLGLGGEQGARS